MSTQPWGLLCVPSDDLRSSMVGLGGACGFHPPRAAFTQKWSGRTADGAFTMSTGLFRWEPFSGLPESYRPWFRVRGTSWALVLRWDRQDLTHGWLAASEALEAGIGLLLLRDALREQDGLEQLRAAGCRIIAVNEHGHEVTP